MYNKIEIQGCLGCIAVLAAVFFIIAKLWQVIAVFAVIAIIYYYAKEIYFEIKNRKDEAEINYEPKNGEIFKVCPYCSAKVKVSTKSCPRCKSALN